MSRSASLHEQLQGLAQAERELLAARAERLAARPEDRDEVAVLQVAVFRIGEVRHALPLEALRAALPLRLVTPVPLAPPQVVGLVRFEGEALVVLSLTTLLGTEGWRVDPSVLLVVEVPGGGRVALDAEEIPSASTLPLAAVEEATRQRRGAVSEVHVQGELPVRLLDLARLLALGEEGPDA